MARFDKGPDFRSPFGRNQYLRSTQDFKTESGTVAQAGVPDETIDSTTQKVLQPGTVLARITDGANTDKLGVYDAVAGAHGLDDDANIVGICNTFVPVQLLHRDVDVAYVVDARVVQDFCFEYVNDVRTALTDATAAAMNAKKGLNILFGQAASVVE